MGTVARRWRHATAARMVPSHGLSLGGRGLRFQPAHFTVQRRLTVQEIENKSGNTCYCGG